MASDTSHGDKEVRLSNFRCRVSSTQEGSGNFSKHHMFDESEDTCWYSKQGVCQWIILTFERPVVLTHMRIMFQGGFVGIQTVLESEVDKIWIPLADTYHLEDCNALQTLTLPKEVHAFRSYRVNFISSSDFYGRITVYKLEVYGYEV